MTSNGNTWTGKPTMRPDGAESFRDSLERGDRGYASACGQKTTDVTDLTEVRVEGRHRITVLYPHEWDG